MKWSLFLVINVIVELYNGFLNSAVSLYYLKKYNGIWGLKSHLAKVNGPEPRLLAIYEAYFSKYGSWIGYKSRLSGVPFFPHGLYGIFISGGAIIGRNSTIFQHVTIGSNTLKGSKRFGSPVIGDNVYIGSGAKIIGNVVIGDNCRIGANAVVYEDMPPHSVAVQSPTRIIHKTGLDNRYFSQTGDGAWVYYSDGRWIEDDNKNVSI